jgi:molybdopterin synthase sulfur carrier subunit
MATILLPAALRRLLDKPVTEFAVEAPTLGEALSALVKQYPELKPVLFDDRDGLRRFVRIFVGGEPMEELGGLAAPLRAKDEVVLLAPIAGG